MRSDFFYGYGRENSATPPWSHDHYTTQVLVPDSEEAMAQIFQYIMDELGFNVYRAVEAPEKDDLAKPVLV